MENALISEYRKAAIAHGQGTLNGDYKLANRSYDTLVKLLKKISESDTDHDLLILFEDKDVWVQAWAAAHYLEIDEKIARAKLLAILDASIPFASTNAEYTLKEWDSGELKFRN